MLIEYLGIVAAMGITLIVAMLLYSLSYVLIFREYSIEKLSAYECGFGAFTDNRDVFDVRFYLVAILFLVFDLEVIFLFPWCVVLSGVGVYGYVVMLVFVGILLVGFIYEWRRGGLDW